MNNERYQPEQFDQELLNLLDSEVARLKHAYDISTKKYIKKEGDAENLAEAVYDFLENVGNAIGHNNPALAELQQAYDAATREDEENVDDADEENLGSENEEKADDKKLQFAVKHFLAKAIAVLNDAV